MKHSASDNLFARLLGKLARLVLRRRQWFVWPQLVLFLPSLISPEFLK